MWSIKFYIQLFFAKSLEDIISLCQKYIFHGSLEKIIEVTYSYREFNDTNLFNETLFEEYVWASSWDFHIDTLWKTYEYKIRTQIKCIERVNKKLQKITVYSRNTSLRRWMLWDALVYVQHVLELSLLWLPFELEKAGVPLKLKKNQIPKRIREIEEKEEILFGPKVTDIPEEFAYCYNFVIRNHETKKKRLSMSDQKVMRECLHVIQSHKNFTVQDSPKTKNFSLKASFMKAPIERKDYRKIFDSVCELYNLPQRTKITNAWSIYDGDHFLEIPRNDAHSVFSLERLLKLLTHEIESHYINSYNGKILLWNFRGAKNLPKEEWLAMFMEKIFSWHSHEDIDNIVEYFFIIMAGECLSGDQLEEFMRVMGKEYQCKRNYRVSLIRAKRNYSFDHIWVQHKDVVYFRGLSWMCEYISSGGSFYKLFLGKVWFHDVENISAIYSQFEKKEDIVFPIFISDLIYYYLSHRLDDENFVFSPSEYYLYIKKKYWFIDIEHFQIIDQVNRKWKCLQKILNMFEKVIVEK